MLNGLSTVAAGSAAGRLIARLDASRIGAFGHSMGGVMAGQFCLEDARCRAGLNMDGSPQSGDLIDRTMARPFLMMYTARDRQGANDAIYQRAARAYYRVDVRDTKHLDFSDMRAIRISRRLRRESIGRCELLIGRFRDRSSVSFSLFRSLSCFLLWVAASPVARSHEPGRGTFEVNREVNRAEEPRFR